MTFDHHAPGTPAHRWDDVLGTVPALELPEESTRVVVLAAHPDDETLGAGGVLAAALRHDVRLIIASDGEASHPRSPSHSPEQLRTIRRHEALAAMAELAPSATITFLGLPDGALSAHRGTITAALREALGTGPGWLLTPWRDDRHPDHEACALAGRAINATQVRQFEYPIWAWHWADPAGEQLPVAALRRISIDAEAVQARRRAMACYRSQTEALSDRPGDEPIVPATLATLLDRPFDILVELPASTAGAGRAAEPAYFDRLYAERDDPWNLAGRWYERRKRQILLASLPRSHFRRAFEPGCATGLLTAGLAVRADRVVAADAAERAVAQSRSRAADNVEVVRLRIPDEWPTGRFDLIVLSEVGYYCADLDLLAARVRDALTADGIVVLCHWRHPAGDHPRTADEAHAAVRSLAGLSVIARHVEEDFLLEVLAVGATSVATTEGIVG